MSDPEFIRSRLLSAQLDIRDQLERVANELELMRKLVENADPIELSRLAQLVMRDRLGMNR